jgi:hypothetical protein
MTLKTPRARGTEGPTHRHFNEDLRKMHGRRQLKLRPITQHTAIMAIELTVQSERAFQKFYPEAATRLPEQQEAGR